MLGDDDHDDSVLSSLYARFYQPPNEANYPQPVCSPDHQATVLDNIWQRIVSTATTALRRSQVIYHKSVGNHNCLGVQDGCHCLLFGHSQTLVLHCLGSLGGTKTTEKRLHQHDSGRASDCRTQSIDVLDFSTRLFALFRHQNICLGGGHFGQGGWRHWKYLNWHTTGAHALGGMFSNWHGCHDWTIADQKEVGWKWRPTGQHCAHVHHLCQ
mmetsp:Transcript_11885/g.32960  ORF Transcript_11885/g.32960 Transcript_11885/m.32960 type:complete len:212 (-) Transcript_11885:106-741(-)